jgi:hypothetical protein
MSDDDFLTLTRITGHRIDIPGAGRWKICNQRSQKTHGDCWICDCKPYTLFFWNTDIGQIDKNFFGDGDLEHVLKQMGLVDKGKQYALDETSTDAKYVPYIRGEFSNWQPVPMSEITDFCHTIDENRPTLVKMVMSLGSKKVVKTEDEAKDYLSEFELK